MNGVADEEATKWPIRPRTHEWMILFMRPISLPTHMISIRIASAICYWAGSSHPSRLHTIVTIVLQCGIFGRTIFFLLVVVCYRYQNDEWSTYFMHNKIFVYLFAENISGDKKKSSISRIFALRRMNTYCTHGFLSWFISFMCHVRARGRERRYTKCVAAYAKRSPPA